MTQTGTKAVPVLATLVLMMGLEGIQECRDFKKVLPWEKRKRSSLKAGTI